MSDAILTLSDIQQIVKPLAEKYHISEVYIFGSYARNEATRLCHLGIQKPSKKFLKIAVKSTIYY